MKTLMRSVSMSLVLVFGVLVFAPMASARVYYTGERGGCYYHNSNGNKTYVDHYKCNSSYRETNWTPSRTKQYETPKKVEYNYKTIGFEDDSTQRAKNSVFTRVQNQRSVLPPSSYLYTPRTSMTRSVAPRTRYLQTSTVHSSAPVSNEEFASTVKKLLDAYTRGAISEEVFKKGLKELVRPE